MTMSDPTQHSDRDIGYSRADLDRKLKRMTIVCRQIDQLNSSHTATDRLLLAHSIKTQLQDLKAARLHLKQRLTAAQDNRVASLAYARSASLYRFQP